MKALELARLRADFDRGFATREPVAVPTEDLLAVRLDGQPFALRVSEIGGLARDRKLVPVPTSARAMIGLASVRGEVLAVYDLAELLGLPRARAPRWIARSGGAGAALGIAFAELDEYVRVPVSELARPDGRPRDAIGAVLRTGPAPRPIVSIPSILAAIERGLSHKES